MAEAGAPGVVQVAWSGMLVRSGTPAPIVERLSREMQEILKDPAFREPLESAGFEILSSTPQAFAERLRQDHAAMGKVVQIGNVRID
jgi:tripartite-type tricarboxylate transporter receptor subunit TctC